MILFTGFIACEDYNSQELDSPPDSFIDGKDMLEATLFNFDNYYYYKGEKVGLDINKDLYCISSTDNTELITFHSEINEYTISTRQDNEIERDKGYFWRIVNIEDQSSFGKLTLQTRSTHTVNSFLRISPVIGTEDPVACTEYFYVKLKSEKDYSLLE